LGTKIEPIFDLEFDTEDEKPKSMYVMIEAEPGITRKHYYRKVSFFWGENYFPFGKGKQVQA